MIIIFFASNYKLNVGKSESYIGTFKSHSFRGLGWDGKASRRCLM